MWNLVRSAHPLNYMWIIAASGWLFSYRHLLRYEGLCRIGDDSPEDFRRTLSGMRIFAAATVLFLGLKSLM